MRQEKAHKIKLVKLLEILRQDSDEDNYLDTNEIINKLATQGIECDRRTLYDDIAVLNSYGYEILCEKNSGKANRYCIVDRSFDVPELRILMDAVQAASFITKKKTALLMEKIADLGGSHRAELLKNNIISFNTSKHTNEQIFYSVSELERGIIEGKKVSFLYFDYNAKKEKIYRIDKRRYYVNPCATVFSNDNYYLVTYSNRYDNLSNYRIDRMEDVRVEDSDRVLPDNQTKFNIKKHKKEIFEMFAGVSKKVEILFDEKLIGPVLDKFGEDAYLIDQKNGTVKLIAEVQVSKRFFAWVCSFGKDMKVVAPEEVVLQTKEYVKEIARIYDDNT